MNIRKKNIREGEKILNVQPAIMYISKHRIYVIKCLVENARSTFWKTAIYTTRQEAERKKFLWEKIKHNQVSKNEFIKYTDWVSDPLNTSLVSLNQ